MAMSDNQNAPQQGQSGAPPIAIHAQYIKDLSFENPLSPGSLMPLNKPPQIDLNVMVKMRQLEGRTFEVALVMGADARNTETNDALFIMELVYCAVVTLGEVPQEAVGPLLLIETPRLLFPFAAASWPMSAARRASRRCRSRRSISWRSIASSRNRRSRPCRMSASTRR